MRGGDAGPDNLICKYTRRDDTLRVVKTMLGTTLAVYYKITPDGLQANDGTVLFNPANILFAKATLRAQIAGQAWYQQLAEVDTALLERHAAAEFQQVKTQAQSAADLMAKQPEQAAQQFDAATAKLKDLYVKAKQALTLIATGPVEVQVREETADGPIIWRGQMEANDSHSLPKRGKLFLTATAMENLQIEIGGKRIPNPYSGRLTVQIP
jgi:hypothetical protein